MRKSISLSIEKSWGDLFGGRIIPTARAVTFTAQCLCESALHPGPHEGTARPEKMHVVSTPSLAVKSKAAVVMQVAV